MRDREGGNGVGFEGCVTAGPVGQGDNDVGVEGSNAGGSSNVTVGSGRRVLEPS